MECGVQYAGRHSCCCCCCCLACCSLPTWVPSPSHPTSPFSWLLEVNSHTCILASPPPGRAPAQHALHVVHAGLAHCCHPTPSASRCCCTSDHSLGCLKYNGSCLLKVLGGSSGQGQQGNRPGTAAEITLRDLEERHSSIPSCHTASPTTAPPPHNAPGCLVRVAAAQNLCATATVTTTAAAAAAV